MYEFESTLLKIAKDRRIQLAFYLMYCCKPPGTSNRPMYPWFCNEPHGAAKRLPLCIISSTVNRFLTNSAARIIREKIKYGYCRKVQVRYKAKY